MTIVDALIERDEIREREVVDAETFDAHVAVASSSLRRPSPKGKASPNDTRSDVGFDGLRQSQDDLRALFRAASARPLVIGVADVACFEKDGRAPRRDGARGNRRTGAAPGRRRTRPAEFADQALCQRRPTHSSARAARDRRASRGRNRRAPLEDLAGTILPCPPDELSRRRTQRLTASRQSHRGQADWARYRCAKTDALRPACERSPRAGLA